MTKFATAIEMEAAHHDNNISKEDQASPKQGNSALLAQKRRELQRQWNADDAARKRQFKAENGFAVGGGKAFLYAPKPQWQYDLWKRVVPFLKPDLWLRTKPKKLAEKLTAMRPDQPVTAKMISAPITGAIALNDLKRSLADAGTDIPLNKPVSIRSIQKALIALADAPAASRVETFSLSGEIRGDTAYVNGKTYTIDRSLTGERRIRIDGKRFYLDPIISE